MTSNSVPSDDRESVSSGSPHNRSAWGRNARQSTTQSLNSRLARIYDRLIEKHGDNLEVIGIAACGAVPSALVFALAAEHGPFWMITTTSCSIGFYAVAMTSVVSLRDKLAEFNNSRLFNLCKFLHDENNQLKHDKAHLLCERGQLLERLHVAESAAAGNSRSENQELPAAVVPFTKTDGAV